MNCKLDAMSDPNCECEANASAGETCGASRRCWAAERGRQDSVTLIEDIHASSQFGKYPLIFPEVFYEMSERRGGSHALEG